MINSEVRNICERIARLEIQRKELADEIAQIKKDAANTGYDKALITKTVALMVKPAARRRQVLDQLQVFDSYLVAVGLLPEFIPMGHDPATGEIHETKSAGEPCASMVADVAAVDTAAATPIPETPCPIPPVMGEETAADVPPGASAVTPDICEGAAHSTGEHGHLTDETEDATAPDASASYVNAKSPDAMHQFTDDDLAIPDFLQRPAPDRVIDRVLP